MTPTLEDTVYLLRGSELNNDEDKTRAHLVIHVLDNIDAQD